MNDLILTVTQVNTYSKSILEQDENLRSCLVVGEISNFTNHYRTGHFYMSLKDEESTIKAVMFKFKACRLKFMPENGMRVLCRGKITIFERDGSYQFNIEEMIPDGIGVLGASFNQLKSKLEKEGLFDPVYKKNIPQFPDKIGVITSPTGAALQDIKNVISRRYPCVELLLYPVQVQGPESAAQLTEAMYDIQNYECDVIIIGRGGGSAEDLWSFNDELLARAIFSSNIPVISAVGHETDYTICDFVADLRAPTPSAAAELAVPDRQELLDLLDSVKFTINQYIDRQISEYHKTLSDISQSPYLTNPMENILTQHLLYFDSLSYKFDSLNKEYVSEISNSLERLSDKLSAFSPLANLNRGYSVVKKDNIIKSSINDIAIDEEFSITMSDGTINAVRTI